MHDILSLDGTSLLTAYRNRTLSPCEVINAVLAAIERHNGAVNAFCLVHADGARQGARASEGGWMRGEPAGPVDCVPVRIKDALVLTGHPTRGGSRNSP